MGEGDRVGFCIDLDGILVSTPIIPMVAAVVDLFAEMEVLGRATQAGELEYARSLRLRCRLLDEVPVSEARRRVEVAALDPEVVEVVRAKADRCHVVTLLPDCWLVDLHERLGADLVASHARVEDDRLVAVEQVTDKGAVVDQLRDRYDRIVAVGTDAADLSMLERADVAVAFGSDPAAIVRAASDYWVTTGRALWQLLRPL